jgi:NAD(P)-dependent dehydrogenase (short-subunit alcohol dehydrogenase family)
VANESDLKEACASIVSTFGRLDILIANAGLVPAWRETEDIDATEWDRVFAVNVKGVAMSIKQAVPLMRSTGGSIVVMGSLNSQRAHPRQCLYTATKHAVLGVVRATALDLGRYNIRVNAIGPGPIATRALLDRLEGREREGGAPAADVLAQFEKDTALGRMATEEDVSHAAVFLATDLSYGISGQILPVDAGLW